MESNGGCKNELTREEGDLLLQSKKKVKVSGVNEVVMDEISKEKGLKEDSKEEEVPESVEVVAEGRKLLSYRDLLLNKWRKL